MTTEVRITNNGGSHDVQVTVEYNNGNAILEYKLLAGEHKDLYVYNGMSIRVEEIAK